jgi:hypothetical protein
VLLGEDGDVAEKRDEVAERGEVELRLAERRGRGSRESKQMDEMIAEEDREDQHEVESLRRGEEQS